MYTWRGCARDYFSRAMTLQRELAPAPNGFNGCEWRRKRGCDKEEFVRARALFSLSRASRAAAANESAPFNNRGREW